MFKRDRIKEMITALRESRPDMVEIFTEGWCYHLFLIIRALEPTAQPWYQTNPGHVYTKVGKYWYDIRGKYLRCPPGAHPMDADGNWPGHAPHRWSKLPDLLEDHQIIKYAEYPYETDGTGI